ncbi:hypothetical protein P4B35_09220 [Pontiellaceae bacterium B12227]|nr:hypothetical protein [Pontiellaceae bacterium B12227]
MNNRFKKTSGVIKGAPSGFVISLGIHAAAFLLAGMLVVFNVVKKEEKKFVPPKPVDRPKMKLKKPKVKVKKTSKPKSTTRIVTKVKRASMPDIQLPEMGGMTDGLGDGIGGFEILPNLEDVTQFGASASIGSDLEGTYYDFNRTRSGAPVITDPASLAVMLNRFFTQDWSAKVFSRYYRAPQKLYTTSVAMPPMQSIEAPAAFGEEDGKGWCWLVHYKGQLVHSEDITFRFWGHGDDALAVRVNGEFKLLACFPEWVTDFMDNTSHHWQSSSADNRKYPAGNHHSVVGDWITLKAHEAQDLEILIGESHGGIFAAMLMVEVKGEEYERNPNRNGPTLPFFKTAEFTRDMKELINYQLQPGEATVEGGPVFNDYSSPKTVAEQVVLSTPDTPVAESVPAIGKKESSFRTWTSAAGKQFEARYKTLMGKSVVLESTRGKQKQVPLAELSILDRDYITLLNPPDFKIELSKSSNQRALPDESPWLGEGNRRLQIVDHLFGVRVKPISANVAYDHELTVEYFVFGDEAGGDNFILLDRNSGSFVPDDQEDGAFSFASEDEVEMKVQSLYDGDLRGVKYGGYLVTISDEEGRVIQHKATHEFLYEKLENLKRVPVSKHFDKDCKRVAPPRPTPSDRPNWI